MSTTELGETTLTRGDSVLCRLAAGDEGPAETPAAARRAAMRMGRAAAQPAALGGGRAAKSCVHEGQELHGRGPALPTEHVWVATTRVDAAGSRGGRGGSLRRLQGAPKGHLAKRRLPQDAPGGSSAKLRGCAPGGTLAEKRLLRQYRSALQSARREQDRVRQDRVPPGSLRSWSPSRDPLGASCVAPATGLAPLLSKGAAFAQRANARSFEDAAQFGPSMRSLARPPNGAPRGAVATWGQDGASTLMRPHTGPPEHGGHWAAHAARDSCWEEGTELTLMRPDPGAPKLVSEWAGRGSSGACAEDPASSTVINASRAAPASAAAILQPGTLCTVTDPAHCTSGVAPCLSTQTLLVYPVKPNHAVPAAGNVQDTAWVGPPGYAVGVAADALAQAARAAPSAAGQALRQQGSREGLLTEAPPSVSAASGVEAGEALHQQGLGQGPITESLTPGTAASVTFGTGEGSVAATVVGGGMDAAEAAGTGGDPSPGAGASDNALPQSMEASSSTGGVLDSDANPPGVELAGAASSVASILEPAGAGPDICTVSAGTDGSSSSLGAADDSKAADSPVSVLDGHAALQTPANGSWAAKGGQLEGHATLQARPDGSVAANGGGQLEGHATRHAPADGPWHAAKVLMVPAGAPVAQAGAAEHAGRAEQARAQPDGPWRRAAKAELPEASAAEAGAAERAARADGPVAAEHESSGGTQHAWPAAAPVALAGAAGQPVRTVGPVGAVHEGTGRAAFEWPGGGPSA